MDIGGTFTDICVFDEEGGGTRIGKVSSTRDPIDAVFEGIEAVGVSPGTEGFRAMLGRRSTSHWKNGAEDA